MLSRRWSLLLAGFVFLGGVQMASGSTVTIVLKEGMPVVTSAGLDPAFSNVTSANVFDSHVDDTDLQTDPRAYWYNYGDDLTMTHNDLLKFDLSCIPSTATIYKAELRVHRGGTMVWSRIITHNWDEHSATYAGPDRPSEPDTTWGPNSDSFFSDADYDTPVNMENNVDGWPIMDVSADVQAMVSGTQPNYGWRLYSDGAVDTSEEYTFPENHPALFISFDPGCDMTPLAVTSLAVTHPQLDNLTVTWLAPLTIARTMQPAAYDLRYSLSPIDDSNWASATPVANMPIPAVPGTSQSKVVPNLAPDTTYYFAMKSIDTGGNISAISNLPAPSGHTFPEDYVVPDAPTNFQAVDVNASSLSLNWQATGDDGSSGLATYYDIRMSNSEITQANFDSATQLPHNGEPRPAGTWESLFVDGLTPGTTYWFAVKIGDEVYNYSTAAIIQVTTPNDQTAPAGVSDLVASGGDAFSANLTWTATGDDGSAGTASSYDIRYSTGSIDASNWDSASVMPNMISPQAGGNTEQFTVSGLRPGTAYYFAMKVRDEAGNVSPISTLASYTTAADPALPLLTTVTLTEKAGVTTDGYPVLLSQVFKQGDVANNVIVRVNGQYLATQTDVKIRWPADSSVKHALVSFILPTLQANESVPVEILAGGPNANQQPMTKEQLFATNFDAKMTVTIDGVPTVVSAREMLRHATTVKRWMSGDICNEFIVRDFDRYIADQLNVQYYVRVFSGYDGIRVDTIVENCRATTAAIFNMTSRLPLGNRIPPSSLGRQVSGTSTVPAGTRVSGRTTRRRKSPIAGICPTWPQPA